MRNPIENRNILSQGAVTAGGLLETEATRESSACAENGIESLRLRHSIFTLKIKYLIQQSQTIVLQACG